MDTNIDYEYFQLLKRLKEVRKAKGLTQKEMGELLDVQERSYHNLETGKTTFDAKKLMIVLAKLGISPLTGAPNRDDERDAQIQEIRSIVSLLNKVINTLS